MMKPMDLYKKLRQAKSNEEFLKILRENKMPEEKKEN